MITSGLILGFIALILSLGGTLILPLCTPCIAIFLGPISGFLAPQFEKPIEKQPAVTRGAYAGVIAGIGAFLGQAIGAIINSIIVGPEGAADMMQSLGLPTTYGYGFGTGYWIGIIGSTLCISLLNILIMAGMGALGGLLWWQFIGSKKEVVTPIE